MFSFSSEMMCYVYGYLLNIAFSLHVCKPWCKRMRCVISIGSPSWFKTEIFPTLRRNQLARPPYRKRTKPWNHCVVSNRDVTVADFYHRGGNGPTTAGGLVLCIFIYIYIYNSETQK